MTHTPEDLARRAANRLAEDMEPALPAAVERHLHAGDESGQPAKYVDPATAIALGGLLVSIANLAWTIYRDLKKKTATPSPEVLSRRIRISVDLPEKVTTDHRDRLIDVVVEDLVGGSGAGR